jgi:hypothetical protein
MLLHSSFIIMSIFSSLLLHLSLLPLFPPPKLLNTNSQFTLHTPPSNHHEITINLSNISQSKISIISPCFAFHIRQITSCELNILRHKFTSSWIMHSITFELSSDSCGAFFICSRKFFVSYINQSWAINLLWWRGSRGNIRKHTNLFRLGSIDR